MASNGIYGNGNHEAERRQRRRMVLPPGVFFMPTDEELLGVYMRNEAAGRGGMHMHRGLGIPTHEIYVPGADPWVVRREVDFPYCKNGEVYCFTRRSRRGGAGANIRAAGSGGWVARGDEAVIRAERTGELLGYRLTLEFVPEAGVDVDVAVGAGHVDEERSNWFMHEYRLPDAGRGRPGSAISRSQELVLCKIFQHREEDEEEEEDEDEEEEEEEEGEGEELPESSEETSSITFSSDL